MLLNECMNIDKHFVFISLTFRRMEVISVIIFCVIVFFIWYCCGGSSSSSASSSGSSQNKLYPDLSQMKAKKTNSNSLFSFFGGSSYSSFVDRFTSLEDVTTAIRKAGLESCGLIFGEILYLNI